MATLSVPSLPPFHVEDAQNLRVAFEGWGTDEKAVIEILAHRDAAQRKQITLAYEELYKENLISRLEKELTGDLETAICYWMFDPIERGAIMANVAVEKSTDYYVIIEIACISSPSELLAIREAYHARYKRSLEEDVASHTTIDFRKLLFALVSAYRYDGVEINEGLAQVEAKILHDAVFVLANTNVFDGREINGSLLEQSEAKILHDALVKKAFHVDEIVRILSTRSKAQLNATFNRYKDEYGTSITKDLSVASANEFVSALRAVIRCIISPKKYYEKVLRNAIDKSGTDEDVVTRVIVMRAEKDLKDIKELYQKRASTALSDAVGEETSGHYKDFLLALIGE